MGLDYLSLNDEYIVREDKVEIRIKASGNDLTTRIREIQFMICIYIYTHIYIYIPLLTTNYTHDEKL